MSQIDAAVVEKLANLSRLTFTPEEKQKFQNELQDILGFISQLQEVNTDNVSPMASTVASAQTLEREDVVTEPNNREENLKSAPKSEMGFFVVPKVIE